MGDRTDGHDRVVAVIQANAASLRRLARLHSLCADDADDAYQRALEIYLRKVDDVDHSTAGSWLRTVVKHEAMTVREQRRRFVGPEEVDLDQWASPAGDGEERAVETERLTRAAEALRGCKRDELSAMVLKAEGHSYNEICSITGWSYTKVNRCLTEGRARFAERYSAIESGAECERLAPLLAAIVEGDASADDMAAARPHLRNCAGCRVTLRSLHEGQPAIRAVVPLGAPGLLARLWEAVHGGVQNAAVKVQAAVEAASATKAAAVAASAAALAGGGAVAVDRAADAPRRIDRGTAALVRADAPAEASAPQPAATLTPPASEPPERDRRRREPRPVARELGFEPAEPAATPVPEPAPARAPSDASGRSESFSFER